MDRSACLGCQCPGTHTYRAVRFHAASWFANEVDPCRFACVMPCVQRRREPCDEVLRCHGVHCEATRSMRRQQRQVTPYQQRGCMMRQGFARTILGLPLSARSTRQATVSTRTQMNDCSPCIRTDAGGCRCAYSARCRPSGAERGRVHVRR